MALLQSAMEHKSHFNKDEALIRMIALGITMKKENGTQFYCYRDGVFYVSTAVDFKESREWNTNDSNPVVDWVNII